MDEIKRSGPHLDLRDDPADRLKRPLITMPDGSVHDILTQNELTPVKMRDFWTLYKKLPDQMSADSEAHEVEAFSETVTGLISIIIPTASPEQITDMTMINITKIMNFFRNPQGAEPA